MQDFTPKSETLKQGFHFFMWTVVNHNVNFGTKTKKALEIRTFFVSTIVDDYGAGVHNQPDKNKQNNT